MGFQVSAEETVTNPSRGSDRTRVGIDYNRALSDLAAKHRCDSTEEIGDRSVATQPINKSAYIAWERQRLGCHP